MDDPQTIVAPEPRLLSTGEKMRVIAQDRAMSFAIENPWTPGENPRQRQQQYDKFVWGGVTTRHNYLYPARPTYRQPVYDLTRPDLSRWHEENNSTNWKDLWTIGSFAATWYTGGLLEAVRGTVISGTAKEIWRTR